MSTLPSWQFPGGPASVLYRALDFLRDRLNNRMVRYLIDRLPGSEWLVVEAGSGPSSGSSCFSVQPGVRLAVAADLDLAALRVGRARDPRLPGVVGDVTRLPLASRSSRAGRRCSQISWSASTPALTLKLRRRQRTTSTMTTPPSAVPASQRISVSCSKGLVGSA